MLILFSAVDAPLRMSKESIADKHDSIRKTRDFEADTIFGMPWGCVGLNLKGSVADWFIGFDKVECIVWINRWLCSINLGGWMTIGELI